MAKETEGGTFVDVNSNEKKGHVNIYGSDPREEHDESIHINIDYEQGKFNITEKSDGETSRTDCNCFLTTSCMRYFINSFNDNCYELTLLRKFRDEFVNDIDKKYYYQVAPIIVEAIGSMDDSNLIYNYIYEHIVSPCCRAIEDGNYIFAYNRYKSGILSLEENIAKPYLKTNSKRLVKS